MERLKIKLDDADLLNRFATKVNYPDLKARPFLGFSEEDTTQIVAIFTAWLCDSWRSVLCNTVVFAVPIHPTSLLLIPNLSRRTPFMYLTSKHHQSLAVRSRYSPMAFSAGDRSTALFCRSLKALCTSVLSMVMWTPVMRYTPNERGW